MINVQDFQPKSLELHIRPDSEFTKRFGKRVKAVGGRYRACRGNCAHRFVDIPNTEVGRALAQEVLIEFGHTIREEDDHYGARSTIIMRSVPFGQRLPAWVTVISNTNDIKEAFAKFHKNLQDERAVKILERDLEREEARQAQREHAARLTAVTDTFAGSSEFVDGMTVVLNTVKFENDWMTDREAMRVMADAFRQAMDAKGE